MPITKKSILSILSDRDVINIDVSADAVDLLNGILEKVLSPLLPKDGGVLVQQIGDRLGALGALEKRNNFYYDFRESVKEVMNKANPPISKETVKRIVRMHAGDVKVPEESLLYVGNVISNIIFKIVQGILENNELQQSLKPNAISGKDIINHIFNTEDGRKSGLNDEPIGPLTKSRSGRSRSKKRRSRSKKRRSSSKKRCSSKKVAVRGFLREGKRIKSYCRKK